MNRLAEIDIQLMDIAREETKGWSFADWFAKGVEPFLSQELTYHAGAWLESDSCYETREVSERIRSLRDLFRRYTPYQVARACWEFSQEIEDFPRLWRDAESKLEVLGELLDWLRNAWPEVEHLVSEVVQNEV